MNRLSSENPFRYTVHIGVRDVIEFAYDPDCVASQSQAHDAAIAVALASIAELLDRERVELRNHFGDCLWRCEVTFPARRAVSKDHFQRNPAN